MPVRADDARPPHVQLAADLRAAIEAGDYRPGQRLPSTRDLIESYGVGSRTAQAAVKVLREEGLVDAQQGRGVFVLARRGHAQPSAGQDVSGSLMLDEARQMLAKANERLSESEAVDDLRDVRAMLAEVDQQLSQAQVASEPELAPAPEPAVGPEPS